jgi:ComF family protein
MLKSIFNLFFPKTCVGCQSFLLDEEIVICTSCRHEIPLTNHHKTDNNEAFQKFYGKVPVEHVSTLFYFHKKGIVQEMIHKLKYKGHEEIGKVIGNWYAEELKSVSALDNIDYIIPVPLHKRKLRQRGYNQVTKFAETLSEGLQIPYNNNVLTRTRYSKTQTKKNLFGRTEVIENIFDIKDSNNLENKHFLLVDDVLTTGSTLEACCRALLKIPNAKISIVCMAMSH